MLRKWLCCLLFICLGLKNVTFALQPFASKKIDSYADLKSAQEDKDISLLRALASLLNLDINGDGHDVFKGKLDKQYSGRQQFQFRNNAARSSAEYAFTSETVRELKHLTDNNRKFSVPAHYHFLFRLTPF